MGFLYIIKRKALTKIGVTVDIQRRMNELKPDTVCQIVRLPRERERLAAWPGGLDRRFGSPIRPLPRPVGRAPGWPWRSVVLPWLLVLPLF